MAESDALVHGYYEDIDDVLSLYHACGLCHRVGRGVDEYPSYETVEFDLEQKGLYILRNQKGIAAAVSIIMHDEMDRDAPGYHTISPVCVIARLAVDQPYRETGMESWVVDAACEIARRQGCLYARLMINTADLSGLHLVKAKGFYSLGIRRMQRENFLLYERILQ